MISRGPAVPLAAALLFFGVSFTSLARKSATYDEPAYVVAGVAYWTLHDYRLKADAPPLVPYLAGLPAWARGLRIPGGRLPFEDPTGREFRYASRVLHRTGSDADAILTASRAAPLLCFGALLLGTTWAWSRALFGPAAGGAAVLLAALSPNLIAHARLATADFACASSMLFASALLWRFATRRTTGRALGAGAGLALALLSKYTALLLLPCTAFVLAVAILRAPTGGRGRIAARSALVLAVPLLAIALAWGWPPAPERYAWGLRAIYTNVHPDYPWFLLGSFHDGPVPYYYPAVLALKVSVPLLLLGIPGAVRVARRSDATTSLCLLLPAGAVLLAAAFDAQPSGLRRVLPVLPVLAVAGSSWLAGDAARRLGAVVPVAALVAWHGASSLAAWPHYIPYFNEIARTLREEHALLDDSNIDWGQDLKALPAVLERHGVERVSLWYYGKSDPDFYGIRHRAIRLDRRRSRRPGVYAVSLHYLIRLRLDHPDHWIFRQEPFARAGTSILLYRVGPEPRRGGGRGVRPRRARRGASSRGRRTRPGAADATRSDYGRRRARSASSIPGWRGP